MLKNIKDAIKKIKKTCSVIEDLNHLLLSNKEWWVSLVASNQVVLLLCGEILRYPVEANGISFVMLKTHIKLHLMRFNNSFSFPKQKTASLLFWIQRTHFGQFSQTIYLVKSNFNENWSWQGLWIIQSNWDMVFSKDKCGCWIFIKFHFHALSNTDEISFISIVLGWRQKTLFHTPCK